MKITKEQLYVGAAVMQIAEHDKFTAINALQLKESPRGNSFLINDKTPLFCKYASSKNSYNEYQFNFTTDQFDSFKETMQKYGAFYIALICVEDSEICCLSFKELKDLIQFRNRSSKSTQDQYVILAQLEKRKSFRAYVHAAGHKGFYAGEQLIVSRADFPSKIFER
ncbi:hypothetical protein KOI40_01850 [Aestuariicella sp. G3-2]|uniref:hypothetical protein n=1 Tax=Pseudomaricurvus albidus TaxID=2842452 RepID=UPI001C0B32E2|nr:hypothetical protein [Aestuariicella albida]MBU3068540.1 hypothetical protein [Aestuariicella albida]